MGSQNPAAPTERSSGHPTPRGQARLPPQRSSQSTAPTPHHGCNCLRPAPGLLLLLPQNFWLLLPRSPGHACSSNRAQGRHSGCCAQMPSVWVGPMADGVELNSCETWVQGHPLPLAVLPWPPSAFVSCVQGSGARVVGRRDCCEIVLSELSGGKCPTSAAVAEGWAVWAHRLWVSRDAP